MLFRFQPGVASSFLVGKQLCSFLFKFNSLFCFNFLKHKHCEKRTALTGDCFTALTLIHIHVHSDDGHSYCYRV